MDYTMTQVVQDQKELLARMGEMPYSPQNQAILDLLGIIVKLSHVIVDIQNGVKLPRIKA
jgi:hypothetical protein